MLPENAITYNHTWDNKRVATFHLYLASEGIDTVFKIHLFFAT